MSAACSSSGGAAGGGRTGAAGGPGGLFPPGSIDRAEDLFECLGVPYDPPVVATHRFVLLRKAGERLAELEADPALSPEERRAALARALRGLHAVLQAGDRAEARMGLKSGCSGCPSEGEC